jgi:hypothetical protein
MGFGFMMKQARNRWEQSLKIKNKCDSKTTDPVVVKKKVNPNYLAVVFMSATPISKAVTSIRSGRSIDSTS